MNHQQRILIVDDNPTNVAILEEMLGDHYPLGSAASGEEALELASQFRPALILLDVMMPGIDGYETCRQLRKNPELRHTKIIMVSAKAMLAERLQGYEAGSDDYVTKPFDQEELLAKVRVYLRLKSAEEVEHLQSNMLSLLSHETHTPLNGILTPVQMLLEEEGTVEPHMLLNMMQANAQRLRRLFAQVITLGDMKAGRWRFEFVPTSLGQVVLSAIEAVADFAGENNVEITRELDDETTTMLDGQQIKTVMGTLLENAIRYGPMDSVVAVQVRRQGNYGVVQVTDHGEGIDPELMPHVFEDFVHADTEYSASGIGVSLAVARQVVLAHGGIIEVESVQNVGTTLTVRLPMRTASHSL